MDNQDNTRRKKQDRDFWLKIASPIFGQNIYQNQLHQYNSSEIPLSFFEEDLEENYPNF